MEKKTKSQRNHDDLVCFLWACLFVMVLFTSMAKFMFKLSNQEIDRIGAVWLICIRFVDFSKLTKFFTDGNETS